MVPPVGTGGSPVSHVTGPIVGNACKIRFPTFNRFNTHSSEELARSVSHGCHRCPSPGHVQPPGEGQPNPIHSPRLSVHWADRVRTRPANRVARSVAFRAVPLAAWVSLGLLRGVAGVGPPFLCTAERWSVVWTDPTAPVTHRLSPGHPGCVQPWNAVPPATEHRVQVSASTSVASLVGTSLEWNCWGLRRPPVSAPEGRPLPAAAAGAPAHQHRHLLWAHGPPAKGQEAARGLGVRRQHGPMGHRRGCSLSRPVPPGPSRGDGPLQGEEDTPGAGHILPVSGTWSQPVGRERALVPPEAVFRVSASLGRTWWLEGTGLRAGDQEAGFGRAPPVKGVKVGVGAGLSVHRLGFTPRAVLPSKVWTPRARKGPQPSACAWLSEG